MAVDLSMPILIVDDYATMIRILRNLLGQLGFVNVDDASDGSGALTKLRARKYRLVISDWPALMGIRVLALTRAICAASSYQ